jgi:hypothetical protein
MDTKKLEEYNRKGMKQERGDSAGSKMDHIVDNIIDYLPSSSIIHSGFIAQEVEQAAKECGYKTDIVHAPANENDNYSLAYGAFVVPLVKAVQEQQKMINDLKTEVANLKTALSGSSQQIDIANNNKAVLFQNEPNPFDGATIIRYFIPENVSNAYVVFYDITGKEVCKTEVKEKGFGKIEASTENLVGGIYSYSIIVDGKAMDTKKMLKSK